ncbi:MAG: hypothetical protein ABIY51_06390, partial [Ferruginibacter sp.]
MKKYLLSLTLLSVSLIATAQNIGIGTLNPNASAMLEITSPNKGLLIPRVALTGTADQLTILSPATSLLVYNTATTTGPAAVSPGFYYWNGAWVLISTSAPGNSSNTWLVTGNGGNVDNTNFIGTTDNVPFNV